MTSVLLVSLPYSLLPSVTGVLVRLLAALAPLSLRPQGTGGRGRGGQGNLMGALIYKRKLRSDSVNTGDRGCGKQVSAIDTRHRPLSKNSVGRFADERIVYA